VRLDFGRTMIVPSLGYIRDTLWRMMPPARSFDLSKIPPPPWVVRPDWPPDSLGWRMGGEQYFYAVREAYAVLLPPEQAAYERAYPQRQDWKGFYERGRRGLRIR
jgi:hypothetical protein